MRKIEELYVIVGENGDKEGIAKMPTDGEPMIAAGGSTRAHLMGKIAAAMAITSNERLRLVKFTTREEIEVFEP